MKIRLAGANDVPAVKAITDAAYAKWIPLISRPPAPMRNNHAANVDAGRVHVGVIEAKTVALLDALPADDCLFIDNLAVHPQWQGRGFASAMLDHAERQGRNLGFDRLRLLTNKRFAANITFYEKRGFEHTHETEFMGGIAVHMMKRIG